MSCQACQELCHRHNHMPHTHASCSSFFRFAMAQVGVGNEPHPHMPPHCPLIRGDITVVETFRDIAGDEKVRKNAMS